MEEYSGLVSIVMSVYDEPVNYVRQSIQSMLDQTYSNFEFIIILDKPDNTKIWSLLQDFSKKDNRIRLILNECNIGLAKSLNKGINNSYGEYIVRMDADDISKADRIEKEIVFLLAGGYDMVSCLADKIDENGAIWDSIKPFINSVEFINAMLPVQDIIIHPTVIIKKSVLRALNGYRPFSSCQDYDLWLRMLTLGYKIGILNEKLLFFRRHRESITTKKRYEQLLNEQFIRLLYKERINHNGIDSFTEENINAFFKKHDIGDFKKVEKENYYYAQYREGLKYIKKGEILHGIILVISSFKAYSVRESFKTSIKARKVRRDFSNSN